MPRGGDPALDNWPTGACQGGWRRPPLFESLLRGLVALLATPFLLLVMLAIGCWLKASGKLTEALIRDPVDRPARSSSANS
jgi:hypothetical protein